MRHYASSSRSERQPAQGTGCIVYRVRQPFLASHRVTLVRVVLITCNVLKGKCYTNFYPLEGHTSRMRCRTRLQDGKSSTSARSACLPIVSRSDGMCLVIMSDEILNVSHQMRPRLPAFIRWWIPPPEDKVTCPLPVLHAVAQNTPHVKASATVRFHPKL